MQKTNGACVQAAYCPCGTGQEFQNCCGPVLAGTAEPATAEDLMRSRYSAFVLGDDAYLAASWHSTTRPADASAPTGIQWRRLRIRDTVGGGPDDATGEVEFIAHFRTADGSRDFLHERSRFARENGRWVYVDGELF
ncbi:YchJ family protein [Enteractinococcus fodinae]|uniref:YchJ family protein n=1 Tax=Enteractinococcus fodinae TaxID=684663 RepID=UPI00286A6D98|nr:YchJ family metal-binding protein [Enteractinococcus fodinae]